MELGLKSLVGGKRIVAIDAGEVPAPPQARYPGEHLYVNCHYDVGMAKTPLAELYDVARLDALEIVRALAVNPAVRGFVSIVVRVQGRFPVRGMERPARRRIYEVAIFTSKLPRSGGPVTPETLGTLEAFEGSEIEDIAELLRQTVT